MVTQQRAYGEQGRILYEYLEALPAGQGVTADELAELLDTTVARVNQLLAKIRQGGLAIPHQRNKERYDPIAIHFDRGTSQYYNLSKPDSLVIQAGAPGEVLKTWLDDLLTRAKSTSRFYEAQINTAATVTDPNDGIRLLSQLPAEQITDLVAVVGDMYHQHQRGRELLRNLRRHRRGT